MAHKKSSVVASVIICTHNPARAYLDRALAALKHQSLCQTTWELIIVDNFSTTPVAKTFDISWHICSKVILEERLGLTQARIRGIEKAKGDLIVFVDDDNCLKENYLELVVNKMSSMPMLGVLGAGKIIPEFEIEPSLTEIPFLRSLALRNEQRSHFSNEVKYNKAIPFGAGICVRRFVALSYIRSCATRPLAASLDRNGKELLSGGDIDLALHACRDEYLCGVLPELELTHLIPKSRIEHEYLIKIAAGHAASSYILSQLWKFEEYPQHPILKWGRYWKNRIKATGLAKKIIIAEYNAERDATKTWRALTQK